jgi:hypothetical protein
LLRCAPDLIGRGLDDPIISQEGTVMFRHHRENGQVQIDQVWHLRSLRLPFPCFGFAKFFDGGVESFLYVRTCIITLQNGKVAFVCAARLNELLNLWKDLTLIKGRE